jgi:hypothetical protein
MYIYEKLLKEKKNQEKEEEAENHLGIVLEFE